MIWRWCRRKQDPGITRLEQRNERRAAEEARQAREAAEQRLKETEQRGAEVTRISVTLRRLREGNHFGLMIEQSMRRRS